MAYCAISDVQELVPKFTFDASSKPTLTQVTSLLDKVAADIDAALQGRGIATPVTSPTYLVNWLKNLNALGVAYRAMQGMFPSTAEKDALPAWQTYRKDYKEGLKAIEDGKLPSALETGGQVASNYTEDDDQDNYPDPAFRKSENDKDF